MNEIPEIETERLILRGHRLTDFPASTALWSDLEVTRLISGRAFTPEECWARLLRYVGHWTLLGFGYWAITLKSDGTFIGESGFADYQRDIPSLHARLPEIGWVISPDHQRQGYASEAVAAITAWGDRYFRSESSVGENFGGKKFGGRHFRGQTMCIVDADHTTSIRVAEKAGYRLAEHTTYKDHPVLLFLR